MWDSVLLAYADRSRMISDEHRKVVTAGMATRCRHSWSNGRVAGLWWAEADGGRSRIVSSRSSGSSRAERRDVEREGERLAAFVGPIEPDVYRRYRTTRARASVPAIPRRASSAARPSRSSTPT